MDYSVDGEGPVPTDDDEATVVVEELPEFLSVEERATLRQHIAHNNSLLTDEWVVQNFLIVRQFIDV